MYQDNPSNIFNFKDTQSTSNWYVVNDGVMGGLSEGKLTINESGNGLFKGYVTTENNGGFSSVRYNFNTVSSSNFKSFQLRIKGDGNPFQFRVKSSNRQRFSYIYTFNTSGDWETISIPFNKMEPAFRGYKLDQPNFDGLQMEEIAFLIGNKKEQSFKLFIDSIILE